MLLVCAQWVEETEGFIHIPEDLAGLPDLS